MVEDVDLSMDAGYGNYGNYSIMISFYHPKYLFGALIFFFFFLNFEGCGQSRFLKRHWKNLVEHKIGQVHLLCY